MNVLMYGGGRQTVAYCILVAQGKVPPPDRIVIADTGREKSSTWDYMEEVTRPMLAAMGLEIEVAPHSLATVDLYAHNGDLLIPAYTETGKLPTFCSNEWKERVARRYLKAQGVTGYTSLIGFAYDERNRIKDATRKAFPLVDLMLTKRDCIEIIESAGYPLPPPSCCWMCPNQSNTSWQFQKENYPDDFAAAVVLEREIDEWDRENGGSGMWLHAARIPLDQVDFTEPDHRDNPRQCGLGMCMV